MTDQEKNQAYALKQIRQALNKAYDEQRFPIFEMLANETQDEILLRLYRTFMSVTNRPVAADENIGSL